MLPPYIIEELRRREEARREREIRPAQDISLPLRPAPKRDDDRPSSPVRGVVIIQLMR